MTLNLLAIAGGTPSAVILLALLFWGGGMIGMLWSAVVCLRKRSVIAGFIVILIILIQGGLTQPWRSNVPDNTDDPEGVEDDRLGHQIGLVWMGFAVTSFALVILAPVQKRKAMKPTL